MTLKLIAEKLIRDNKKLVTSEEIKDYCEKLSLNYLPTIKYLISNKYLARIFKGIFYVYSLEERKLGKSDMSHLQILKEALKIKGVNNWYFGLETGLKFNNLTHEYFSIEYIINDKIFRAKPISVLGYKIKFYKIIPSLFSFGIIKKDINYSDPEKTLLDLVYLNHYSKDEFEEIANHLSKNKLIKYSKKYSKKIINLTRDLNDKKRTY